MIAVQRCQTCRAMMNPRWPDCLICHAPAGPRETHAEIEVVAGALRWIIHDHAATLRSVMQATIDSREFNIVLTRKSDAPYTPLDTVVE